MKKTVIILVLSIALVIINAGSAEAMVTSRDNVIRMLYLDDSETTDDLKHHWCKGEAEWLLSNKVFSKKADGNNFGVNDNMTLEEALTLIFRMSGYKTGFGEKETSFKKATEFNQFEVALHWWESNNSFDWSLRERDNSINKYRYINKGEFITLLYQSNKKSINQRLNKGSDYYKVAMPIVFNFKSNTTSTEQQAIKASFNVLHGSSQGFEKNLTRAEAAIIIYRAFIEEIFKPYWFEEGKDSSVIMEAKSLLEFIKSRAKTYSLKTLSEDNKGIGFGAKRYEVKIRTKKDSSKIHSIYFETDIYSLKAFGIDGNIADIKDINELLNSK